MSSVPFLAVNLADSLLMFEVGEVYELILAGENVFFYLAWLDTQDKYIFVDGNQQTGERCSHLYHLNRLNLH